MDTIRHNSTLSPVQAQVAASLAAGASISAAAKAAGVHRSTVHNWLKDPAVSTEFDTSRHEYVESLRDQLRDLSALALDTLRQLMENPSTPASVRFRAVQFILTRSNNWALPEPISSPIRQLQKAETAALEAELNYLRLAEELDTAGTPPAASTAEPVGRNSPCPCGSKLKYKRCCGVAAPPILNKSKRAA